MTNSATFVPLDLVDELLFIRTLGQLNQSLLTDDALAGVIPTVISDRAGTTGGDLVVPPLTGTEELVDGVGGVANKDLVVGSCREHSKVRLTAPVGRASTLICALADKRPRKRGERA